MIEGVIVDKIHQYSDGRGWLKEIYRSDEDNIKPRMSYISHTHFNEIRGPHEHISQTDFFIFVGPGNFELYLWDNRQKSLTYDVHKRLVVGESNKVNILVPPGVVHGYKSISKEGSFSINLPDKLYAGVGRKEKVDEIRHENDANSRFRIL